MALNALTVSNQDTKGYIPTYNKLAEKTLRWSLVGGQSVNPLHFDMTGYTGFTLTVSNPSSQVTIRVETSNDGVAWSALQMQPITDIPTNLYAGGYTLAGGFGFVVPNGIFSYYSSRVGKQVRISQNGSSISPTPISLNLINYSPAPKNYNTQIPGNYSWYYKAAQGGIINTTPVQLIANNVLALQNCISSMQLTNAGTVGTEVVLQTGVGTSIWRDYIAAGQSKSYTFSPALVSLVESFVGQSINIVTTTATILYANVQGFIKNS